MLAVSSTDGYCSLLAFDREELGMPLPNDLIPSHLQLIYQQNASPCSKEPSPPFVTSIKPRHAKPNTVDSTDGDGGCGPETVQPMTLQQSGTMQSDKSSEEAMDLTESSDTAGLFPKLVEQDGKQKQSRRICFTTLPSGKPCTGARVLASTDVS